MRKVIFIFITLFFLSVTSAHAIADTCGVVSKISDGHTCSCAGAGSGNDIGNGNWCCGWPDSSFPNGCAPTQTVTDTCGAVSNASDGHVCNCAGTSGEVIAGGKFCCGWQNSFAPNNCSPTVRYPISCGVAFSSTASVSCSCPGAPNAVMYGDISCCGWMSDSIVGRWCAAAQTTQAACGVSYPSDGGNRYCPASCPATPFNDGGVSKICCGTTCAQTGNSSTGNTPGDLGGVTSTTFDTFNKAIFGGAPDAKLTTPRGIISKLLPYLFTFGGLILFVMLIWGGFEMLTGAADPKSQEAGKQRITAAIIGFILLFSSYWLAQLVQSIFGISIL